MESNRSNDFPVLIAASAYTNTSGSSESQVHAISVTQPPQSWTVFREYQDFINVSNVLQSIPSSDKISPCPSFSTSDNRDYIQSITTVRNALQNWLSSILQFSGVRESQAIQHFLCQDANVVPPQYQELAWVSFTPIPGQSSNSNQHQRHSQPPQSVQNAPGRNNIANPSSNNGRNTSSFDEMEMADMFGCDDEHDDELDESGMNDEDDDDILDYSASARYQPTSERITQEDAMEIQEAGEECEMIEDVGSYAQSLGASHLGRSLQLQAEHMRQLQHQRQEPYPPKQQQGLTLGKKEASAGGGIGDAVQGSGAVKATMQPTVPGLGDSFHQNPTVSAPRLDSFIMIKVIGKGSFGKVFLVREKLSGEMFALKVLRKDNIIKRNQVEHTRTERSVLGYVKHPFIVGLNMAFQSKDKLYFVLDYCAGGELFFHLGKLGKFPEARACFYAAEITLAISYVHELDIIYRDLKPENVLLDARGHVRLTDFGLSKEGISNSSSGANSFCGTPEYLAPEILNRQGHGRAVDWWSLGALLYEMLTGLPPFYCRDRERLFEKIRRSDLAYPRYLSNCAILLLRGLLTRDPRRRLGSGPTDADDIKAHPFFADIDWEKLRNGEIPPPWNPNISGSLDTSQFDKEFTSMPISPSSLQQNSGFISGVTPQENVFEGFTFTNRTFYRPES